MTMPAVALLYDALEAFEGPYRGDGSYPVHKRLRLDSGQHDDIYDWAAEQLDLRGTDRVLDAGCGVGFGTSRLAAHGAARVTGITISDSELARATRAAETDARRGAIEFRRGSFDSLPSAAFDVVVAIESLKHSADLRVTLGAIRASLADGGRLLIVEDVFDGDEASRSALRVVADWSLAKLYREHDYVEAFGGSSCRIIDLTARVRWSAGLALGAKRAAVNAALLCPQSANATALRAVRGGLHLENLYARGEMRYLAFLCTRDGTELS